MCWPVWPSFNNLLWGFLCWDLQQKLKFSSDSSWNHYQLREMFIPACHFPQSIHGTLHYIFPLKDEAHSSFNLPLEDLIALKNSLFLYWRPKCPGTNPSEIVMEDVEPKGKGRLQLNWWSLSSKAWIPDRMISMGIHPKSKKMAETICHPRKIGGKSV